MTHARHLAAVALFCVSALVFCRSGAVADDAALGAQLVQSHCISCHGAAPISGEIADSPPFGAIARKYGYDASALAAAILGPHPRMNFVPAPDDARAIAAYLSTLPR